MWIVALIVVAIIALLILNSKRTRAAMDGMTITVNRSAEDVMQIVKKSFPSILWRDNGSSFTRKAKQGYGYTVSVEVVANGKQTTVRLWLSVGGRSGASAYGKIKGICKKLEA